MGQARNGAPSVTPARRPPSPAAWSRAPRAGFPAASGSRPRRRLVSHGAGSAATAVRAERPAAWSLGLTGLRDRVAAGGGSLPGVSPRPPAGRCPPCCPRPAMCRVTYRAVKRVWQAGEFWRVGPGKTGGIGENKNKAPSTYEVEGALSVAPYLVGQLPGLPCTAGRPPVPATAADPGFPVSPTSRSFLRVVPVSGGEVISTPSPRCPQESRPIYFCSFPNPHDIHTKQAVIRT